MKDEEADRAMRDPFILPPFPTILPPSGCRDFTGPVPQSLLMKVEATVGEAGSSVN